MIELFYKGKENWSEKMEKKKDENNFSKKQSNILIAVIVLFAFLITTGILLSNNVKDTYSAGTGTVTFKGANGQTLTTAEYGIPNDGVCTVDSKGYVDPECVVKLANICREISDGESVLGGSTNCSNYTADQVFYKNTVDLFTQPIDVNPRKGAYYCRACTSCQRLFEKNGLKLAGLSPNGHIVEMVDIENHPFFVGTQSHPEFKSRPNKAHPLFKGFINAACNQVTNKVNK